MLKWVCGFAPVVTETKSRFRWKKLWKARLQSGWILIANKRLRCCNKIPGQHQQARGNFRIRYMEKLTLATWRNRNNYSCFHEMKFLIFIFTASLHLVSHIFFHALHFLQSVSKNTFKILLFNTLWYFKKHCASFDEYLPIFIRLVISKKAGTDCTYSLPSGQKVIAQKPLNTDISAIFFQSFCPMETARIFPLTKTCNYFSYS